MSDSWSEAINLDSSEHPLSTFEYKSVENLHCQLFLSETEIPWATWEKSV